MNDEEQTRRLAELRDRVRRGPSVLDDAGRVDEDELVAALADGSIPLDEADEAVLGGALDAHGTDYVLEAVADGARRRSAEAAPEADPARDADVGGGRVLDGWSRFRSRAAAATLLAAAVLAAVLLRDGSSGSSGNSGASEIDVSWSEVAALELAPDATAWTEPDEVPAEAPAWEASMRGASDVDPSLRRATAVVRVGGGIGGAAVVDATGWLVTASDLVAREVEAAAWRGGTAVVPVEFVDVDARGRAIARNASPLIARVMRFDPFAGLALLRVEGLEAPLEEVLPLGTALGEGEEAALVPPPEWLGEVAFPGTVSGMATTLEGRTGTLLRGVESAPGRLGAAIVRPLDGGGAELVGVVLGRTWEGVVFAPRVAIAGLLADRPVQPELFPIDPWATPVGCSRQTQLWDAGGRLATPSLVYHRRDAGGTTTTVTLPEEDVAVPLPPDHLAPGRRGAFRPRAGGWDTFVLRGPGDRAAVGVRGSSGESARVWTSSGSHRLLWERNRSGRWDVRPTDESPQIGGDAGRRGFIEGVLGPAPR